MYVRYIRVRRWPLGLLKFFMSSMYNSQVNIGACELVNNIDGLHNESSQTENMGKKLK